MIRKIESSTLIVKHEAGDNVRGHVVSLTEKSDDPKTIVLYHGNNAQLANEAFSTIGAVVDSVEAAELRDMYAANRVSLQPR